MSDLDEILVLIGSFFAAVVILLILLTWLEATMSEDYVPWGPPVVPSAAPGQE